jgi:glycerate kinase
MAAAGGRWISTTVMGPLPDMEVEAGFVWLPDHSTALVEMATASGLPLLRPEQRNPWKTTTYGTGQLIQAALDHGASHILLAIGGSATVDGGVGAAMALGWRFLTKEGEEIGLGGGQLSHVARIIPPARSVPVRASRSTGILPVISNHGRDAHATETPHGVTTNVTVEVLCDVDNPLCGEHGAARVYGPQKGATPEMVEQLDAGLAHLARAVKEQLGRDIACLPGAGAAGGLAAGAVAFMNARLVPGIDAIMSQTRLTEAITGADWVVTGEGSFDEQSLRGKVVSGVTRVARAAGAKIAVCAGQVRLEPERYRQAGIEAAVACMEPGMELDYAIAHGAELLDGAARRFAREYLSEKETGP